MIPDQWYAVLDSREVKPGKVLGVRRFGENLAFFRDQKGEVGCVVDLCAHRGASLAGGCVTEGHVRCPFHGIEYARDGSCTYIPSEGKASTMDRSRFHLKHYEVREVGGILFVWYGEGKPQGEPLLPSLVTDPSFTYDHTQDLWRTHYSRVIENQLDVSHLAFVHHNTIGRGGKTLVNGPKVVWLKENVLQTSANNEVDTGQRPKPGSECVIKSTNLTFYFPNLWVNHVTDKIQILAFFIPVDEEASIIALRFYNKITGVGPIDKLIAWFGSRANRVVERQDKRVVETQEPKRSAYRMQEKLLAADRPIVEYRRRRDQLQKEAQKGEMLPREDK